MQAVQQLYGTDRDLEARYGIKRRLWQKYRMIGTGPAFRKCGRLCLYEFKAVEEWLANQPLMRSTVELVAA
jgi:hypothetical protein